MITILYGNHMSKSSVIDKSQQKQLIKLKEPFFKYMLINASLNLCYCVISLFSLIISCQPVYFNSVLTSNNCFIRKIVINVICSFLKLTSNFFYLQMFAMRYMLIGKKHSRAVKTISRLSMKKFGIISIGASCTLSLVVYYEDLLSNYEYLDTGMLYQKDFNNLYIWGELNVAKAKEGIIIKIEKTLPLLIPFTIVYEVVSYLFFCLLSTWLDVVTILKLRETLGEKARLKADQRGDKETNKAEMRGIIMIVLNSLFNFVSRFPELLTIFAMILFTENKYTFKRFCYDFQQCLAFTEMAYTFYILLLSANILFFYFLNKSFKSSFKLLILCFTKRLK